ncbi:MAG: regulatory iron-sulfur-containing complex subunit RicT [Elusimicrobiota bacterium]
MPVVVDLLVRRKEDTIYGDVGKFNLNLGEKVIVDIDQTQEVGTVLTNERLIEKHKMEVHKIIRKLTNDDVPRLKDNCQRNIQASKSIIQKIEDYELAMKLTCVEYSFDRSRLFIYYTADTRIDFRQLIKDLGHILKTRIQMVQIGVRDEAKMLGGFGPCGCQLCCKTFLKTFSSVTVEMAKIQDPSLNIAKMTGVCGRLMCCIAYEDAFYSAQAKRMPKYNSKVQTPEGPGIVTNVNYIKDEVTVELSEKQTKKFKADQVTLLQAPVNKPKNNK